MLKRIYPYSIKSKSSKALQKTINEKLTHGLIKRTQFVRQNQQEPCFILNWGKSSMPNRRFNDTWINHPANVAAATNKLKTFVALKEENVYTPDWTTDTELAQAWVDEGHRVYGRKTLTGHSGSGIIIFESETICTPDYCQLYTKDTKADYEYRVHVMAGEVIDEQQKKKRNGHEGGINGIRNHVNGWVFARQDISVPEVVREQAVKAVQALGLNFGAVDIGYNSLENKAYVYEVNTAPGLTGTTLKKYAEGFERNWLCQV